MAKGSGGTRSTRSTMSAMATNNSVKAQSSNAPTNMHAEKIIKDYAKKAMHSNQTENDIRKFEDKRLKQLIRTGSRYREGLLEEVVQQAIDADKQGKRWNTGWAEGFKSEINRVANLKVIHDNIPVYQKILKERKKK